MIEEVLLNKFENVKLKRLTGGYTNNIFLLEGSLPSVIAKVSNKVNDDGMTEISSLNLLRETKITPKMHDYFESDGYLFILMDYIQGLNSQSYLDDRDVNKSTEVYKLLGKHLAEDIHCIKRMSSNLYLPTINLINIDLESLNFIPQPLINEVRSILNIYCDEDYVLIHGDYGPHNAISSQATLHIVDWEWAGWGHPLQDISWVVWFVHLHYPKFAKDLSRIFLQAYRSHSNISISEEQIRAFAVSRIINIMGRISNASIDVQKEWIRRLQWTLNISLAL